MESNRILEAGDLEISETNPQLKPDLSIKYDSTVDLLDPATENEVNDPFSSKQAAFPEIPGTPAQPPLKRDSGDGSMESLDQPLVKKSENVLSQPQITLAPDNSYLPSQPKQTTESPFTPESPFSPSTLSKRSRLKPVPPSIDHIHYRLPTRRWTDPLVFFEVPVKDTLNETISSAFSTLPSNQRPQRPFVVLEQVAEDPEPYEKLVQFNAWRVMAQLARNDIIASHPMEVEMIMRFWYIRWSALLKLKYYDIIIQEIDKLKISDMKEYSYEEYPEVFPERKGCMISFPVLLLINTMPSFKGIHYESVHKLFKMVYPQNPWDFHCTKEQHLQVFKRIISVLVKISDIPLAITLLTRVIEGHEDSKDLYALLGRLHLQMGNLEAARLAFSKIENLVGLPGIPEGDDFGTVNIDTPAAELLLTNRGLLHFGYERPLDAIKCFTEVVTLQPESATALNNLALCYLYSGNVTQAQSFLESFIISNPKIAAVRPEMISNLVLMYELTDSSPSKKKSLLKAIIQNCGDDFEADCLKF